VRADSGFRVRVRARASVKTGARGENAALRMPEVALLVTCEDGAPCEVGRWVEGLGLNRVETI